MLYHELSLWGEAEARDYERQVLLGVDATKHPVAASRMEGGQRHPCRQTGGCGLSRENCDYVVMGESEVARKEAVLGEG